MCMEPSTNNSDINNIDLIPLTPEFNEENHGSYVKRINSALDNRKIRNIALSGTYGVGKSSILQKVAEEYEDHIVEISLSTLAPKAPEQLDDSIPKQASTTTNRIQQEIVKQLLYRVESHQAPRSRFNRIENFNCKREHGIAVLAGIVFTLIFLLMGWTEKIVSIQEHVKAIGAWIHVIIFLTLTLLTLMARYLFQGRFHISQLSTGNAAISLDEKSVSYFDQYLDEIVYFFEVSGTHIVIFEDIDRFEDSYIFETLRSLNTLLNNAPQFENKSIRFIYAVKDSIFEKTEDPQKQTVENDSNPSPLEESEIVRANRTKFFDLIIPVVPFITHRSARDIVSQLLNEISHDINDELINIAARYVPDMRLLKNALNEFIIFREKLFAGSDKQLNLNESELFAMMLYKSTHLSDFELIRLGKSKLDEIYRISRNLVAENISQNEQKIRNDQSNQKKYSLPNINRQSKFLGEQLIEFIECTALSANYQLEGATLKFNDKNISKDHLKEFDFWKAFIISDEQELHYHCFWQDSQFQRRRNMVLAFKHSKLPNIFSVANTWIDVEKKDFHNSIRTKETIVKKLRSAHMKELIKMSEFLTNHKDKNQSFDSITHELFSNGLVYQLIKSGYINDNFTLYTSIFHGNFISSTAQNFIIHNVKPNIMDEQLILNEMDIKAIISECGVQSLSEPCLYNISILNYLLIHDPVKADIMVQSLIQLGNDELRFLQAYLNGENEHDKLIKKFAQVSKDVFNLLITHTKLDDGLRRTLVNATLKYLSSEIEYILDDEVSEYLQKYYSELPVLASSSDNNQAEIIAQLYSNAGIRLPELQLLSKTMRNAFIAKSLYEINIGNLKIALANEINLALDVALEKDTEIYQYLLRNLGKYLQAIVSTFKTVTSSKHFIRIIDDVLASKNPDNLDEFVANASDDCIIENLDDVQTDAWQCLAEFNRFSATFENITSYISTIGSIDKYLENLLIENSAITDHESVPENEKEKLAIDILHANKNKLTAEHRVQLTHSLKLKEDFINASDLPIENSDLYALLLKIHIIEDDATIYEHLSETDWSTKEGYIQVSREFKNYITPELLCGDLADFLSSDKIGLDTKISIVERAEEFTENCSKNDLEQLAQFAIEQNITLSPNVVEDMASNDIDTKDIILLLAPNLTPSMDSEQLFRILELLKGDYSQLVSKGKDQPKIPNTPENQKLIDALKALEIINSVKEIADGFIKIFKKHK